MRWLRRRDRREARSEPEVATAQNSDVDALAERLRQMRGNNLTAMPAGSGSTGSGTAYSGKQLAQAARDALFVDRSIEDDRLSEITEYRSIDD